jgi:hypothetical protein
MLLLECESACACLPWVLLIRTLPEAHHEVGAALHYGPAFRGI